MRETGDKTAEQKPGMWRVTSICVGIFLFLMVATGSVMSLYSMNLPAPYMRNIALDCLAMIVSFFVYLSGLRNPFVEKEKQVFMFIVAVNIFNLYLDEICWMIVDDPAQVGLNLTANTCFYLTSIVISWMFWYFVGNWKGKQIRFFSRCGWVINIVAIASAGLILYNVKSGLIFSINLQGNYSRNSLYWLSLIGPGLILFLTGIQIMIMQIPLEDKLALFSYPILPVIGSVMGIFIEGPTLLAIYVFIGIMFNYSNLYVRRVDEASRIEGELAKSELNALMLQINPHFIYNTLGSAASLCDIDPSAAQDLIYHFSDYLRDNFTEINRMPLIPFREELRHLESYIAIEKVRFPNIEVEYDLKTENFELPAFTLQPLVENSIKHGICKRRRSAGTIWIEAMEMDAEYLVRVIDDGVGFSYVEANFGEGKHVGIENVRTRLQILCGGSLKIEGEPGVGTTCVITIPKTGR